MIFYILLILLFFAPIQSLAKDNYRLLPHCVDGHFLAYGCKGMKSVALIGCCNNDLNVWCEVDPHTKQERLCYNDCTKNNHPLLSKCGWDPHYNFYYCFDGKEDPGGTHPFECPDDCTPNCKNKECGYDGCYGICGRCPPGKYCDQGHCVNCSCKGRQCGANQCGQPCGTCPDGELCTPDGRCIKKQEIPLVCKPHKITGPILPKLETCVCNLDPTCCRIGGNWDKQCIEVAIQNCGLKCPCKPDCNGKECGSDGCGGSCGSCKDNQFCFKGMCRHCLDCSSRECGPDGCGHSCGRCPEGKACVDGYCMTPPPYCVEKNTGGCGFKNGDCNKGLVMCVCDAKKDTYCCDKEHGKWDIVCVNEYLDCANNIFGMHLSCPCIPHCENKECGPDGCGGSCGSCADNEVCFLGKCTGSGAEDTDIDTSEDINISKDIDAIESEVIKDTEENREENIDSDNKDITQHLDIKQEYQDIQKDSSHKEIIPDKTQKTERTQNTEKNMDIQNNTESDNRSYPSNSNCMQEPFNRKTNNLFWMILLLGLTILGLRRRNVQ